MPNRRSPDAALSPAELISLVKVAAGVNGVLPHYHRDTFVRMQLAELDGVGNLVLTDAGRVRHEREMVVRKERHA
jgi:hypothetical protein